MLGGGIRHFSYERGRYLSSLEWKHILDMDLLSLSVCNASANNTICAPREGLISCHNILYNIVK